MTKSLTDIKIRSLKPDSMRREIPDGNGLYLIVQPSGARSFALRFRRAGWPAKLTLGAWFAGNAKEAPEPKVGGTLTLAGARKLAAEAMHQVGKGHDPVTSKRQAKEEQERRREDTFRAISDEYLKRVCGMRVDAEGNVTFDRSKKRTGRERHLMLKRLVYPVIGHRPIAEIRRKEIVRLLDRIEDKSGPVAPDRVLALLSVIMTWHAKRDDSFATPLVKGMARTSPGERARDRKLADHEIRTAWKVAENQGTFGRMVKFILLTAARRTEAAGMVWAELDGIDWTLPASRNKTKVDLIRPLSRMALDVLEARPKIEGCPFVFTNDGQRPATGFAKAKRAFDLAVLAELRKENPKAEPLKNWVLHDLRRSSRSLMSRAGIDADHAEHALGHLLTGMRKVYDRHEFYDEKKKALEMLAAQITAIVDPPPTNVLPFKPAAGDE
jgi:integrase